MTTEVITRRTLAEGERADFVHALFGPAFPLKLEPTIFTMADMLAEDYNGGYCLGLFDTCPRNASAGRVAQT
jgi:hypothetical protein